MNRPLEARKELQDRELAELFRLSRRVDALLEVGIRARESLQQTFARCLPELLRLTGARGICVETLDDELRPGLFTHGEFGGRSAAERLSGSGPQPDPSGTWVGQALDVAGAQVGALGLWFEGPAAGSPLRVEVAEVIAEELDQVLVAVQTAAEKHQLILAFNRSLAHPSFEHGMDAAVRGLAERLHVPGFLLLHRDAVDGSRLHYRCYRHGALKHEDADRRWDVLDRVIAAQGPSLLVPEDHGLRELLGPASAVEAVLIPGGAEAEPLGKIVVWSENEGFSVFTLEVLRVLASTLTQRLMDHQRERVHLSQFFSTPVIDELLRDPGYETHCLSPRDAEVGILFADINGFTRICERVLQSPSRIGRFVDRWSTAVVDILWRHGGVFDKMVGDCIIGLFGPPLFREGRVQRAEALVRAALEIQAFTGSMSTDPEVARLSELANLPGLGVAVGLNLDHAFCGIVGPNRQYTGFSTGMNQTARLQALGGFREILVMESVRAALEESQDPALRSLGYGPLVETPVKNVGQPLRHHKLGP